MYTSVSSAPSSFSSSIFSSVFSSTLIFSSFWSLSSFFSFSSLWSFSSVGNSFFSLGLLLSPFFFSKVVFLFTFNWGLVASRFLLFGSGFFCENDFDDSEESLLFDSDKSLLFGFININNFSFFNFDNLVETSNSSFDYFSNPKCFIHQSVSSFNGNKAFSLSEEQSKSSGDVTT